MYFHRGRRLRNLAKGWVDSNAFPWVLGVFLTLVLSVLMTTSQSVSIIHYQLGDVVRRDIKAPDDMRVEDLAATEVLRQKARDRVLPRYDVDSELEGKIEQRIRAAFEKIQKSLAVQSAVVRIRMLNLRAEKKQSGIVSESQVYRTLFRSPAFHEIEASFGQILGGSLSSGMLEILRKERYVAWIGDDLFRLVRSALARGVVSDTRLYAIHTSKGIVTRDIRSGNIVRFPSSSRPLELREVEGFLIRQSGKKGLQLPRAAHRFLAAQAAKLVQPTLNFNNQATVEAQKRAAAKVPAVRLLHKKGEMIVREGERVTKSPLMTLRALERSGGQAYFVDNFLGTVLLVSLFLVFAWTAARRYNLAILRQPKNIVLFVLMLTGQVILIKLGIRLAQEISDISGGTELSALYLMIPLASASMLAGILLGRSTAIMMAVMSSVVAGFLISGNIRFTVLALAGGVYAAINWKDYRHRTSILFVGFMIAIANATLVFGFHMQAGIHYTMAHWADLPLAFVGGIVNIIVVSAVMPLFEAVFKPTTDMKLLELSDQNHPLLRQLVVRAPGTYHHSLLVGNLAEEAAEAVNANPLLARVGAYFHDIGKIDKPEYFIENQGPVNRHDKLNPSMSALILISHVKEGLELARKHQLPKEICDFICQHHGTSLIRYFYEKAKEQCGDGSDAREEVFRYPGPRPQTRQAGIMMLADMVEAASRSLSDTSPARLAGLVERIVHTAFSDGQLDECDLTLRHLSQIQEAFLRVLAGIYHHRVVYPEQPGFERKGTNGDIRHKPAKEGAAQPRAVEQAGGGGAG